MRFAPTAVIATALLVMSACDVTEPRSGAAFEDTPSSADLRATYSANLEYLGDYLRSRDATLADDDVVRAGTLDFYSDRFGAGSATFTAVKQEFDTRDAAAARSLLSQRVSNDVQAAVQRATAEAESFDDFLSRLAVVRSNIVEGDLGSADAEAAMAYVVLLEETMLFLNTNRDFAGVGATEAGASVALSMSIQAEWWDSWGKCAAGVLGGAIIGGLTGAATGSVVPALGTTAGGVVGAIGGGLTGAAASC